MLGRGGVQKVSYPPYPTVRSQAWSNLSSRTWHAFPPKSVNLWIMPQWAFGPVGTKGHKQLFIRPYKEMNCNIQADLSSLPWILWTVYMAVNEDFFLATRKRKLFIKVITHRQFITHMHSVMCNAETQIFAQTCRPDFITFSLEL